MTTARDVITLSLKEAGILGVGQTALAEDINDGFTLLKNMLAQWQKRRWIVPALMDLSMPGNGQKSNTIGPGGYWDVPRPNDIKGAYFIQLNTQSSPISFQLRKIFSYEDYIRIPLKELSTFSGAFFYDGDWPLGNVFIYPIPSSLYEVHLLVERQLVFTGIQEGSITTPGAGYVNAVYSSVPLTGGSGSGAKADITIASTVVTNVQIVDQGKNYVVGNVLSADNDDLGGTGAGFTYTITSLNNNVDYEFELPEEYEEALHYNLAVRFISMYQVQNPSPQTGVLAKLALNTIKKANSQIPTLVMPRTLRTGRGNRGWGYNLYDPGDW